MRLAAAALALLGVVVGACVQGSAGPSARDLAACLAPSNDPRGISLPALVDRADIIVLASVVRIDTPPVPSGVVRDMPLIVGGGERLTLRVTETVK